MQYQLPNGKVINLTIEEYLNLTDDDIQFLIAYNYGDTITDPFTGSTLNKNKKIERVYDFDNIPDDLKEDDTESKSNMNETDIDDLDISY